MGTNSLRSYIDANASLPPDVVLGNLTWYSVGQGWYNGELIEREFARLGLNPAFLPNPINPVDAFDKASSSLNGRKYQVGLGSGGTATAELLVREVTRNHHVIERHLIREVRDSAMRRLSYERAGTFLFFRPALDPKGRVRHESIRTKAYLEPWVQGDERTLLEGFLEEFNTLYDRHSRFHDEQKVRTIFRNYLLFLNAILLKSSVYFVHSTRSEELQALSEFAANFDTASMTTWQLPDIAEHRAEVIESFQQEGEKRYAKIVEEIQEKRGKKITAATWTRLKSRYDETARLCGEYSRVLGTAQDRTGAAAQIAREALIALQGEVLKGLEDGTLPAA